MANKPTERALRAAEEMSQRDWCIQEKVATGRITSEEGILERANFIDRETGIPELEERLASAIKVIRDYLEWLSPKNDAVDPMIIEQQRSEIETRMRAIADAEKK